MVATVEHFTSFTLSSYLTKWAREWEGRRKLREKSLERFSPDSIHIPFPPRQIWRLGHHCGRKIRKLQPPCFPLHYSREAIKRRRRRRFRWIDNHAKLRHFHNNTPAKNLRSVLNRGKPSYVYEVTCIRTLAKSVGPTSQLVTKQVTEFIPLFLRPVEFVFSFHPDIGGKEHSRVMINFCFLFT